MKNTRAFVLELAAALQGSGVAAHRLEETLTRIAARLGVVAHFFSTPTALMVTFGRAEGARTSMVRVHGGEIDLGRLAQIERVAERVAKGSLSTRAGREVVREIVSAPPRYSTLATLLAFAGASGASARFFGGGWREMVAAWVLGLMVGALGKAMSNHRSGAPLFETTATALATILALLFGALIGPFSPQIAVMSGLVVLLPGYTVTTAVSELTAGHLISGSTRLFRGGLTLLAMGFGLALGGRLATQLAEPGLAATPLPLPGWTEIPALLVAVLSFTVLFRIPIRGARVVAVAGAIAIWGAGLATHLLGPEMGALLAAAGFGLTGRLYQNKTGRPAAFAQVPGIMMLVPGSVGFRSINALLEGDPVAAVQTAFSMALIAMALVAGLLLTEGGIEDAGLQTKR